MNWYKTAQEELWIVVDLDGKSRSDPLPKEQALIKQKDFQSEGYPSKIIKARYEHELV